MIFLQTGSTQSNPSLIFTIIISIIGSGALSALITFFTNNKLKQIDYRYDFKKYVLQKRQAAYNDIEILLIRLGKKQIKIDKKQRIHNIFLETHSKENPIYDFLDSLTKTLNQNIFWISKEIHDQLIDILNFLSNYHTVVNGENIITLSQLEQLGFNNYIQIEKLRIAALCPIFLRY